MTRSRSCSPPRKSSRIFDFQYCDTELEAVISYNNWGGLPTWDLVYDAVFAGYDFLARYMIERIRKFSERIYDIIDLALENGFDRIVDDLKKLPQFDETRITSPRYLQKKLEPKVLRALQFDRPELLVSALEDGYTPTDEIYLECLKHPRCLCALARFDSCLYATIEQISYCITKRNLQALSVLIPLCPVTEDYANHIVEMSSHNHLVLYWVLKQEIVSDNIEWSSLLCKYLDDPSKKKTLLILLAFRRTINSS